MPRTKERPDSARKIIRENPLDEERTAQIFSAPTALGAKLCAQRDLSALFWRLLPQAFWFCHPAQKQQRRAFLQSLRGSMASAFAPPPPPPPADSADSAPVQDGKQKHFLFLPPGSLCWDRTIKRQPRCVQPVPRFALLLKLAFTTVFPVFSRRDLTRLCPNGRARRRRRRCRFLPLQIRNDRPRNQ